MDKGVLFIGHSSDAQAKIIIGIRGTADHVAVISPEEALRFAENLVETLEKMGINVRFDDFEDFDEEVEEPTD
jgi:hypothetical protein